MGNFRRTRNDGLRFPAAIGAQIAKPDELVIAIVGDAGFQMTLQELSVLKRTLFTC